MKNPLSKRYKRELKKDWGKYLVIFLFMVILISLVSGYFVTADSVEKTYYEGYEKYNLEDGHLTFNKEPDREVLKSIEEKAGLKFYDSHYFDEDMENGSTVRVFKIRETVNKQCLYEGRLPEKDNEIALDRLFAKNNDLSVGDVLTLNGKELTVTGIIALPDYNCMFKNASDMMFNATTFGVGVMTDSGYEAVDSAHEISNFAWKYNEEPKDETEENSRSEDLLDVLEDVIKDYDTAIVQAEVNDLYAEAGRISDELTELMNYEFNEDDYLTVDNYVPRYQNKAITYCMDDMAGDRPMYVVFDYIVIVILAFIFAITISNTIAAESGAIGTLRASGYTRGELIRHYMFLPVAVALVACIVGNILGYTYFVEFYKSIFYNSFCLAPYESVFNTNAFVMTTVLPMILLIIINLFVLSSKLKLSPIRFLRHDLKKHGRKKAVHLSHKIPFMHRFRIRILFQNIPSYIVLMIGILFGGMIVVFGWMFAPLLEDYSELIKASQLCEYQYAVKDHNETSTPGAEKYWLTTLNTDNERYLTDEISVYGIVDDSAYINMDIPEGAVLVTNGFADKFGLEKGDTFSLKEPYDEKTYDFVVGDIFQYDGTLALFMNEDEYLKTFDEKEDDFVGYFSNQEIKDIDEKDFAATVTGNDLVDVANQLLDSMGSFMGIFAWFGMIMFLLLMYLMTKQVIENNMQSIAMTKILGYRKREIAGLYLVITSLVVIVSLLISIPLIDQLLRWMFREYIYTEMTGYIPYIVSNTCYVKEFVMGIVCYGVVAFFMMFKIGKIEKSEALKNME